jgi:RNA polymerase sigma factor (TIGR02999 family)
LRYTSVPTDDISSTSGSPGRVGPATGGQDITALLRDLADGRAGSMERLMPLVYDELQRLARHHRFAWGREPGFETKSLVHEAYLKLVGQDVSWESRRQFYAIASRAMRSILIDNARRFARQKREGGRERVAMADDLLVSEMRGEELLDLDRALRRLEAADEQRSRIVEYRVFGGLTVEETAEALGISPATVKRSWTLARAWLYQELSAGGPHADDGP